MSTLIEEMYEQAKRDVEGLQTQFDAPDDDWLPMLLIRSHDDTYSIVGIDTEFMASEVTKNLLADEVLPDVIRKCNAKALAFIVSAWQASAPEGVTRENLPRPSQDPNRREVVFITCMTATETRLADAQIVRHEKLSAHAR